MNTNQTLMAPTSVGETLTNNSERILFCLLKAGQGGYLTIEDFTTMMTADNIEHNREALRTSVRCLSDYGVLDRVRHGTYCLSSRAYTNFIDKCRNSNIHSVIARCNQTGIDCAWFTNPKKKRDNTLETFFVTPEEVASVKPPVIVELGDNLMSINGKTYFLAFEIVDKAKADVLLSHPHAGQRTTKDAYVGKLMTDMSLGRWGVNNDSAIILTDTFAKNDTTGLLCNGNHRMTAISKTGIAQPMMVLRTNDESIFYKTDTIKSRSIADLIRGEYAGLSKLVSQIAQAWLGWGQDRSFYREHNAIYSNGTKLEFIKTNKDLLMECATVILNSKGRKKLCPERIAGAFLFGALQKSSDKESAKQFIEEMYSGETTNKHIFNLREKFSDMLDKSLTAQRDSKIPGAKYELLVKTYNAIMRSEPAKGKMVITRKIPPFYFEKE